jgi:hypothetical protein
LLEGGDPEVVGVGLVVLDVALVRGDEAREAHLDDALLFDSMDFVFLVGVGRIFVFFVFESFDSGHFEIKTYYK